jgi:hypothetical protein
LGDTRTFGVSAGAKEVEDSSPGPLVSVVGRTNVIEVLPKSELRTVEVRVKEMLEDCPKELEEADAASAPGRWEVDTRVLCEMDWLGTRSEEEKLSLGTDWSPDADAGCCINEAVDDKRLPVNVVELATAVDACTVDMRPIRVDENVGFLSIPQVPVATCAAPMELFSEHVPKSVGLYTTATQFTLLVHLRIH